MTPKIKNLILLLSLSLTSNFVFLQVYDTVTFPLNEWRIIQADTVLDLDSNVYHIQKLGSQYWFVENLSVTKFNNGDEIANLEENSLWTNSLQPSYCDIYGRSDYNGEIKRHGILYNGYTVIDDRNVCPAGWHVPTENDWNIFLVYLDSLNSAWTESVGGIFYTTGENDSLELALHRQKYGQIDMWNQPYLFFSRPLNGRTSSTSGDVFNYNGWSYWWCSDSLLHLSSWYGVLDRHYSLEFIYFENPAPINSGMSIRCVRD